MNLREKMIHAATVYDEKQSRKPGFNRYALPQYIERINDIDADIRKGADVREAIVAGFSGRLATAMLKAAGLTAYTEKEARSGGLFYSPTKRNPRRHSPTRASRSGGIALRAARSATIVAAHARGVTKRATRKNPRESFIELRDANGRIYFRASEKYTSMADLKQIAVLIMRKHGVGVTAHRVKR